MSKRLGEMLKKVRALSGATLREVEKATKISNAYLSQLESGSVDEPSPHKLQKLATYFKIEYANLMEAAGYLTEVKRPSAVNSMLLTSQDLTEEESAALSAFLVHLRNTRERTGKSGRG